ncbi:MAG: rhomboid family intramembrane serine protease [Alphaproteobacteria bacterium]|nr:rhomboid family intramembrane serine protease [Alphaproteobacteria bacterium]
MFYPLYDANPIRHVKRAYVTYGLIAINVVIFAVQFVLPASSADFLTVSFGMIPIVVRDIVVSPAPFLPDQIGLLSYAFLHADIWHLGTNMLFLWVFGDNVEDAMGHVKFLLFYIGCAILAALAHLAVNPDSAGPLIGASGAVAGIIGAYLMLYPNVRVYTLVRIIIPLPIPVPASWVLGFWIASQVFYAAVASAEPVAWWAHIGGFVAGVVFVAAFKRSEVKLFGRRS